MARKSVSEKQIVTSGASAVPARRKSASPNRVSRPAVDLATTPGSASELQGVAIAVAAVASAGSHQDAVARLAYSYWEARGYQGGSPEADWLRAEQELSAK